MDTINGTQTVFQHHVQAFIENNIEELMKDYSEESEVWTPQGKLTGKDAIRSFYTEVFKLCPARKSQLEIKQMITNDEKVYIVWSADSALANIPTGTDTFEIKEDKIVFQTLAAHIIMK